MQFDRSRFASRLYKAFHRAKLTAHRLYSGSKRTVQTKHGPIVYFAPNKLTFERALSLYSDEPETIAWIDSFVDQDVFWDIGANVGIYSIYAAARPSMTVLAFEPAAANYSVLCRSIELNGMDDRVLAYCLALNDHKNVGRFSMRRTKAGIAKSSFDVAAIHKNQDRIKFRQAMIGYTIDDFIEEFDAPFPHHIKIDVDGNDHLVLAGATRTLADRRVKSVLVELVGGKCDREREASAMRILLAAGLTLDPKSEEARHNRIFWRS